jgi:acetyl-CoA synthetase
VGHLSTMYWLGLRPGDIHLNVSSPGWAKHSWSSFFAPWNAEATVFVFNTVRFKADQLLDVLERCGVTSFCAPPTVWRMLIKEDFGKRRVQLSEVTSAGEPLNPEVVDRIRGGWGLTIRDGYGQTETTALVGNSPGQPILSGSMGRVLPGYEIVLVDPDGCEVTEGEISLKLNPRPIGLTTGNCSQNNASLSVRGEIYRTGDIAVRSENGYLTFVGRADDIFKSSDYRISPFELESALVKHPDVMECAVVPTPDSIRLFVPKAFITLRDGLEPSIQVAHSIFRHIRVTLAPYKRVRRIEFIELPKTVSGKIRRIELRRSEMVRSDDRLHSSSEFREEDFPELLHT